MCGHCTALMRKIRPLGSDNTWLVSGDFTAESFRTQNSNLCIITCLLLFYHIRFMFVLFGSFPYLPPSHATIIIIVIIVIIILVLLLLYFCLFRVCYVLPVIFRLNFLYSMLPFLDFLSPSYLSSFYS
jgi:hypothetical protein